MYNVLILTVFKIISLKTLSVLWTFVLHFLDKTSLVKLNFRTKTIIQEKLAKDKKKYIMNMSYKLQLFFSFTYNITRKKMFKKN